VQIHTIETPGLGDSTYIFSIDGVAGIVDPQRDIDRFESYVHTHDLEVRWILETHLHNDYVSGGRDVARALGAELVVPAGAAPAFRHRPAFHMEEMGHGRLAVRPIHTPGHTPEHVSYLLLIDGVEQAVFTGGSLLVGSAGRSDLLGQDRAESLARLQFQSLQRLAELPEDTDLFPTHGAGSFCTAAATGRASSTIGVEKRSNPALAHNDSDSFVTSHLSGLAPYPAYYEHMGAANTHGLPPANLALPPLLTGIDSTPEQATFVDGRPKADFAAGHIPGALGIELRKDFGVWVGWLTEFNSPLVLILNEDQDAEEAVRQLARIGYDDIRGLITDLSPWSTELVAHQVVDAGAFATRAMSGAQVIDVRAPSEWEKGTITASNLVYAPHLADGVPAGLDPGEPVLLACGTGYRASIAASLLERHGYQPEVLIGAGVPEVLERIQESPAN